MVGNAVVAIAIEFVMDDAKAIVDSSSMTVDVTFVDCAGAVAEDNDMVNREDSTVDVAVGGANAEDVAATVAVDGSGMDSHNVDYNKDDMFSVTRGQNTGRVNRPRVLGIIDAGSLRRASFQLGLMLGWWRLFLFKYSTTA